MRGQDFNLAVSALVRATSPENDDLDIALDSNRIIGEFLNAATEVEKNGALYP